MCSQLVRRNNRSSLGSTRDRSFPKSRRLLKRSEFDRVYRDGARSANAFFSAVCCEVEGPTRVGLAVGRSVGGAVVRNRVKRLLREAVRNRFDRLPDGWDVVLQARKSITDASAYALDAEIQLIFHSLAASVPSTESR